MILSDIFKIAIPSCFLYYIHTYIVEELKLAQIFKIWHWLIVVQMLNVCGKSEDFLYRNGQKFVANS